MLFSKSTSIKNKLRRMMVAVSLVALVLAGGGFVMFAVFWFQNQTKHEIETIAAMISDSSASSLDFDDADNAHLIMGYLQASPEIVRGYLFRTNGDLFAAYQRPDYAGSNSVSISRTGYNSQTLELLTPVFNPAHRRVGALYLQAESSIRTHFLWSCALVTFTVFVVVFLIAVWLARKFQAVISQPIDALLDVAMTVSRDKNYSLRAVRHTEDELGQLVQGVNEMLHQIEIQDSQLRSHQAELEVTVAKRTEELRVAYAKIVQSYEDLKKLEGMRDGLTDMIVHDLRTPLLGVGQMIEVIKKTSYSQLDGNTRQAVDYIHHGSRQLSELIDSLLDASRLEAGEMPLHKTHCDLRVVVRDALQTMEPLATGLANIEIDLGASSLIADCDEGLIQRVIVNLVDNAFHSIPVGGKIQIRAQTVDNEVRVEIIDNGKGIPHSFLERIFEKFAQVDARKHRHTSGLGLNFCKLAIEAHHGEIGVISSEGVGSTFWFTLISPSKSQ